MKVKGKKKVLNNLKFRVIYLVKIWLCDEMFDKLMDLVIVIYFWIIIILCKLRFWDLKIWFVICIVKLLNIVK